MLFESVEHINVKFEELGWDTHEEEEKLQSSLGGGGGRGGGVNKVYVHKTSVATP